MGHPETGTGEDTSFDFLILSVTHLYTYKQSSESYPSAKLLTPILIRHQAEMQFCCVNSSPCVYKIQLTQQHAASSRITTLANGVLNPMCAYHSALDCSKDSQGKAMLYITSMY